MNDEEILLTLLEKLKIILIDISILIISSCGLVSWFVDRNAWGLTCGISFGFVFVLFTIFMVIFFCSNKERGDKRR